MEENSGDALRNMSQTYNANQQRSQDITSIQQKILDTEEQLNEILDRFFYSAIEKEVPKIYQKDDFDENGKATKRNVTRNIVKFIKLPSAIKTLNCSWFPYYDEKSELTPLILEFDEDESAEENKSIREFYEHLRQEHGIKLHPEKVKRFSRYKDWHPLVNRNGLERVKAFTLGMVSPTMTTTKYKKDSERQLLDRAIIDAHTITWELIANKDKYGFSTRDISATGSVFVFLTELFEAVKLKNVEGFLYKGIVQTSNESRIISESINRGGSGRGLWDRVSPPHR